MDSNKLKKLEEIGYCIKRTCGNCKHATKSFYDGAWDTCEITTYDHLKHSDSKRKLSIHQHGCCSSHELTQEFVTLIHGFSELIEK